MKIELDEAVAKMFLSDLWYWPVLPFLLATFSGLPLMLQRLVTSSQGLQGFKFRTPPSTLTLKFLACRVWPRVIRPFDIFRSLNDSMNCLIASKLTTASMILSTLA